ncbi:unnamed protein product [Calypogeia fissa]
MAAAVNYGLVVYLSKSPLMFAGFVTRRPNLPLPLNSGSNSLFFSSSSDSRLGAQDSLCSQGHYGSSYASHVSHAGTVLAFEPQTDGFKIEEKQVDHLEQLGVQRLGGKEKKELRAYAHGLGTRLNVQQVGKLGVSQTVIKSISDALEAHEILKVKVLENCSSDMSVIITQLELGTRGQVVGKIGRTVLLYRASQRKLAASEKKIPEKSKQRRK